VEEETRGDDEAMVSKMTPTLYPHEWVLKRSGIIFDYFIEAIILLTFGLGVAIVIVDGRFVNVLILGFLMLAFSMIISFMGRGQYYGRRI
jgi:uncharacterized membrane protein